MNAHCFLLLPGPLQNVLVRLSRETELIGYVCIYVCMYVRVYLVIIRIDSWLWRREVLQSALCKLENEGSMWYNSLQVWRPEDWGTDGFSPGLHSNTREPGAQMSEGWRRWMSHLKWRENKFALHLLVPSGPNRVDDVHSHWGGHLLCPPIQMLIFSGNPVTEVMF